MMFKLVQILSKIFVFILLASSAFAYDMPIGIPDPIGSWGGTQDPIEDSIPTRPADWSSTVPGYYYVNDDTGSDSGNTYGTPSAPRDTIPNPIPAGSYVEVHGAYDTASGGNITINGSGTSAAWSANTAGPVWIVHQDGDSTSKFDTTASKIIIIGDYIYIDGVRVDGAGGSNHNMVQVGSASVGYDADYITIRNSTITGNTSMISSSGVGVVGDSANVVTYICAYNNTISNTGDTASETDDDAHITTVGNYSQYVWFLNNTIHTGSGSGTQVGGANNGADNCHHVYFGDNENYGSRQGGFWVKYANTVIFSQNTIHDIIDTSWSFSKGLGCQYENDNIWFLFNEVYGNTNDMTTGVYIASGSAPNLGQRRIYIIGNVIHDIENGGNYYGSVTWTNTFSPTGIFVNGGDEVVIAHNTIWDLAAHGITVDVDYVTVYGNIVGGRTETSAHDMWFDTNTNQTIDYNQIYHATDWSVEWGSSTEYTSLSAFQSGASTCTNCIDTTPTFTDQGSDDYSQTSGSNSVDAGDTSAQTVYSTFNTAYSLSIAYGFAETSRPQNTNWDIGAYEYTSGGGESTNTISGAVITGGVFQ